MSGYTSRHIAAAMLMAALSTSAAVHAADKERAQESKKAGMSNPSMQMHRSMMEGAKESMGMKPSGNMDRDFATMMRHHHVQGVKMAEYELQHGKDAKMRDMAQKIIDAQKREIAEFDEWLKTKPQGAPGQAK